MPRVAKATASKAKPKSVIYKRSRVVYPTKRYTVRGHGGYWDNVKKRWGEGGGTMKSQFEDAGNILGGPLGRQAGGLINRALYAITGFGDYKVKYNTLLETNGPPMVVNQGKEFIVRHREYIGDVYSGSGSASTPSPFHNSVFPINPGNGTTFPWLTSVSERFEQYRIQGMAFEFKSLYSDAVVTQNGSIGSIVLATEYNAGSPPFSTKQQMENYEFAQSGKPSLSILHPIECARSQSVLTELYITPGGDIPEGQDVKTYNFGDFQIASQGIPLGASGAAVNLGELWVTYEIALLKPKISGYLDSGYARFNRSAVAQPAGSQFFEPNWDTAWNSVVNNIGVIITGPTTFTIPKRSTPRGYQVLCYVYDPTNSTSQSAAVGYFATGLPTIVGGGSTYVPIGSTMANPTTTVVSGSVVTSGSIYSFYLLVDASPAANEEVVVNLPSTGIGAGLNVLKSLVIQQVPAGL